MLLLQEKAQGLFGKLFKNCFRLSNTQNSSQVLVIQMDLQMWLPPLTHFSKQTTKLFSKHNTKIKHFLNPPICWVAPRWPPLWSVNWNGFSFILG
jgi:hypothetical protein